MDNNDKKVIVGKKQILRLLKENHIKSIRIATDAQDEYVRSIREEALRHNVKVVAEGSMEDSISMKCVVKTVEMATLRRKLAGKTVL